MRRCKREDVLDMTRCMRSFLSCNVEIKSNHPPKRNKDRDQIVLRSVVSRVSVDLDVNPC
jgi:hypothetical protein